MPSDIEKSKEVQGLDKLPATLPAVLAAADSTVATEFISVLRIEEMAGITIDLEPEHICTTETLTREVTGRPGRALPEMVNFRGWIITDYNPVTARIYAEAHIKATAGNKAHIMASVVSDSKEGQAVGVVCFGDLHENLDKGLVCKVFFPFSNRGAVVTRDLAAIRHAFQEGVFQVEDRGQDNDEEKGGVKMKSFTVVTTSIEAVREVKGYSSARTPRPGKLCYDKETLLRDIAELSSEFAEQGVVACLYYAPENATGPLQLAAINASFGKELKVVNRRQ